MPPAVLKNITEKYCPQNNLSLVLILL